MLAAWILCLHTVRLNGETHRRRLKLMNVEVPGDYERGQEGRAVDQMAKAGVHLAGLWNAVRWR